MDYTKRIFLTLSFGSLLLWTSCDQLNQVLEDSALTDAEIVEGLKEALTLGLNTAVTTANATDGYLKNEIIKILLPDEVKELQETIETESLTVIGVTVPLSTIYEAYLLVTPGEGDLFDALVVAMNRGAERAADKALPIFGQALRDMSIQDALGILQGGESAATDYFYTATNAQLQAAFQPEVRTALDEVEANAIYEHVAGFVNYEYEVGVGPLSQTVSVSEAIDLELPETIDSYATEKAIDGLFYLIGEEEKKIRADPFAWANAIIEKVFGSDEALGG